MRKNRKTTGRCVPLYGAQRLMKAVPTAIVLLSFASVCFGGSPPQEDATADAGEANSEFRIQNSELSEPPGKPVSPDRRGIAPNQSASLDDSEALTVGAASETSGVDSKTDTREIAAQGAASVGRRVPRDVESSTRPAAPTLPDVPWYRTGIGALSIVLAVIAAAVWCVRRWMPTFGGTDCAVLNVVGRAGLSPKHSVALVSLGRRFVLVGLSGDRMTRICEVSDPQEVADLTLRLSQSGSGDTAKAFESLLTGEVNEYANDPKPATRGVSRAKDRQGNAGREPLSALLKRLRSLQMK